MGKTFAYLVLILIGLFALEWFGIIDIPYIDLPDFDASKQDMMHQTEKAVENME